MWHPVIKITLRLICLLSSAAMSFSTTLIGSLISETVSARYGMRASEVPLRSQILVTTSFTRRWLTWSAISILCSRLSKAFLQQIKQCHEKRVHMQTSKTYNQPAHNSANKMYTCISRQIRWKPFLFLHESIYSEPSLQWQHLFPKMLPLKWISYYGKNDM